MSALITLYCDTQGQYGSCTGLLYTEAATVAEAQSIGRAAGWRTHSDGHDYCPRCSGSSAPKRTKVARLRATSA